MTRGAELIRSKVLTDSNTIAYNVSMSNPSTTPIRVIQLFDGSFDLDAGWFLPTFGGPERVTGARCDEEGRIEWVVTGKGLSSSSWAVGTNTLLYSTPEAAQAAYDARQARYRAIGARYQSGGRK